MKEIRREKFIGFKVSDQEDAIIRSRAAKSNLDLSKYVRLSALNKQIVVIDGLEQWLPELSRIGNNLNQLTVILHTRNISNPDFAQVKSDFALLVQGVVTVLQGRSGHGNYQDRQRKAG